MYLASSINQSLENHKSKLLGWNPYSSLTTKLEQAFRKKDLKFKYERFPFIDKDDFSVSGLYDMTTNKRYVILNVSDKCFDFRLKKDRWEEFKFFVSQVVQHETLHQMQWQYRDECNENVQLDFRNMIGTKEEERVYLSDLDEIDAYGHDIAMEIKFFYPDKCPYEILKTLNKRRKVWSYSYYKKSFKGCEWSGVKNRLLKKTFLWLPHVTI